MDNALWSLLTGSAAVAAICGDRIYWGMAPQGVEGSRLVLNIISGADAPHLRGTDGLWFYRVQIDSYGDDRPAARALDVATVALLNGHRGGGFDAIFIDTTREAHESGAAGRPFRLSTDYRIIWRI